VSRIIALRSENVRQTLRYGQALGESLEAGDLVAISGPLGAGKTQLVKGIARGLRVPADEPVVSPSFVLVREYGGRLKLYHVDAYRLRSAAELIALGWDEMREQPGSVVVIEWSDRVPAAIPEDAFQVELEHDGPTTRRIRLAVSDERRRAALARRLRRISGKAGRHSQSAPGHSRPTSSADT
jgi:tRNA threonylcarbamoyladenosine biosynthesis protein TsaE